MKRNDLADPIFEQAIANLKAKQKPIDYRPDDPVGWIGEHFRIPREERADMRLILAPYQQYALTEAFTRDARGRYQYSTVVWSDLKKTFKSVVAAAVILWKAWHSEWGTFFIVANDLKQADSRVAHYLRRAIQLHPELNKACTIKPSGYSIAFPNHTTVEAIPIDPEGEAGSNADFIEWTEAWGLTSAAHVRMFAEMAIPPAKLGRAMRWADTYAGFAGESLVLEQLYDVGVTQGTRIHDDYELYVNRSARMLTLWNTKPRLEWHTPEHLLSEEQILTTANFRRFYHNEWASSSSPFVPREWWMSCQTIVTPYAKEPCVMAVDAGVMDDTFGIIVMSKKNGICSVRYARAWVPPRGGQIDFEGTAENPGPELEIIRLCKEFVIIEVAFDSMHILDLMARLEKKHGIHIFNFSQGSLRLMADKALRDTIRNRTIAHSGEPDLTSHIMNANAKIQQALATNSDGTQSTHETIRIVKRNPSLKCDLAVCLSMSNHELNVAYAID